jgi:hypothetical protein
MPASQEIDGVVYIEVERTQRDATSSFHSHPSASSPNGPPPRVSRSADHATVQLMN